MLCEKCGKNTATTHIRTVVNGHIYEKHLCSFCAAKESNYQAEDNNFVQILGDMFGSTDSNYQNAITRCTCCGATYDDITESGKCGCPQCYATFYNWLLPQLKRIHGSIDYVGKKINATEKNNIESISELNDILKKLIDEENYEQAAIVRDKIKRMKEGAI